MNAESKFMEYAKLHKKVVTTESYGRETEESRAIKTRMSEMAQDGELESFIYRNNIETFISLGWIMKEIEPHVGFEHVKACDNFWLKPRDSRV